MQGINKIYKENSVYINNLSNTGINVLRIIKTNIHKHKK